MCVCVKKRETNTKYVPIVFSCSFFLSPSLYRVVSLQSSWPGADRVSASEQSKRQAWAGDGGEIMTSFNRLQTTLTFVIPRQLAIYSPSKPINLSNSQCPPDRSIFWMVTWTLSLMLPCVGVCVCLLKFSSGVCEVHTARALVALTDGSSAPGIHSLLVFKFYSSLITLHSQKWFLLGRNTKKC